MFPERVQDQAHVFVCLPYLFHRGLLHMSRKRGDWSVLNGGPRQ